MVPASAVSLLEDWDAIGLRGTGSTSVTVRDLFVPDERISPMSRILRDEYAAGYLRDAPIYWMPMLPLFAVRLVCPIIGMGKAALEFFLKNIHTRGIAFTIYQKQSDTAATHLRIGEASAKLDAAESIRKIIAALDPNDLPAISVAVSDATSSFFHLPFNT